MINRNSRASHVMLPCVASTFSATARRLFATERTADLGTARTNIDVNYPAVRSAWADPLQRTEN